MMNHAITSAENSLHVAVDDDYCNGAVWALYNF